MLGMNKNTYKPFFDDHEVLQEHCKVFNVDNYNDLIVLLKDKDISSEQQYDTLYNMYDTMVSSEISSDLISYHPDIKKNFFQIPKNNIIKDIYTRRLYEDGAYHSQISNLDYTKIDELTIEHLSFLFLEEWEDKYEKMNEIIGNISDHIVLLQQHFSDTASQEKALYSYIIHFLIFVSRCLSSLQLYDLGRYNPEEYSELSHELEYEEKSNNPSIRMILDGNLSISTMDLKEKELLVDTLVQYQHQMTRKYHELFAAAIHGGIIKLNELSELLFRIKENNEAIIILKE